MPVSETTALGRGRRPAHAQPPLPLDLNFATAIPPLRNALLAWYQNGKRPLPWRTLWQERGDPYTIWVSEIMLQQTVIKAVIPVYARFLDSFPTVASLAAADEEAVKLAVRGLGYYRRFRFLHQAAKELTAAGGAWPQTFLGWKELPGIGDYTAAAISSIAFGAPAAVVDGNVERVFCRLLDRREAPNQPHLKKAFQRLAGALLDREHPGDFNQALMELGQTVCTPSSPRCEACPLAFGCLAQQRGSQALAPAAKIKAAKVQDLAMELLLFLHADQVALLPRPAAARFLGGTLGFLTTFAPARSAGFGRGALDEAQLADGWPEGAAPARVWPRAKRSDVGSIRHSITHHRIAAEVVAIALNARQAQALPAGTRWVASAEVEGQLVANLDRKAWHRYQAYSQAQAAAAGPLFAALS